MHIAIEGLDGAGKTSAARLLASQIGYVYQENPIYRLVGQEGANHFLKSLCEVKGDLHSDIAAFFYGAGNLYLNFLNTSFQVFGRTYPPQKAHYSGKNESGSDFLPLWEATPKPSKIQPQF